VSGLGTAVEQPGILQPLMISLYRKAAKKANCVFFQNEQNRDFFIQHKMYNGHYRMIPGSGVNLDKWKYMDYPSDENGIHFLFVARIIKEKGIEEYLSCAKTIKEKYANTVFHILGPCDGEYKDILDDYEAKDIIKYHGEVSDTSEYLKFAHCTIHPSYYPEGISNVLLESEASGRPVITTDRAGCRETVEDGVTGFCFETRNTQKLIEAVDKFVNMSNADRQQMGKNARLKMEREFDRNIVVEAYLKEMRGNNIVI
jgi:glycosyltransferase involved in cell wall biosynthesis